LHLQALRIRLWLGEVDGLSAELTRCARSLEQEGETANRALLLCEEGCAWDRAGDLARARACWQQAERLCEEGGHSPRTGVAPIHADVLLQLGRLDHLRGHLASALGRYDQALRLAAQGAQTLEVQLRRLLVRLDLNQWDQARSEAESLLGASAPDQLAEEVRPLAEMVRGLLDGSTPPGASTELRAFQAAARGDVAAARSLYAEALAATPSPERQARLALSLGLLALNHTDWDDARSWLRQAEGLARSLDLPEVLARTLLVRGQMAAEQEGDDDLARRLFEEVLLVTEVQAGQFTGVLEALPYRQQRGSVLRYLLRSAGRRGDAASFFRYQERERGRLLLGLLETAPPGTGRAPLSDRPDVAGLGRDIAACEGELLAARRDSEGGERRRALLRHREELLLRRDRLFEDFLRDRGRRPSPVLPALPELVDLQRALPRGTLYVAPALVEDELYVLAVTRDGTAQVFRGHGPGHVPLREQLEGLRGCLESQVARYRRGLPLGRYEREELDRRLDDLGRGPLGSALSQALDAHRPRPRRLLWVPDGPLHGLPVHALRRDGRYLIEDHEVVWSFGGALCVHQARTRGQRRWPFRPAVVVSERPSVLADAQREGEGVAASFAWGRQVPAAATDRRTVSAWLARARAVHFACHADFDGRHPLAACVHLPSGEAVHALEWLDEPVAGLPLVTLSACRAAEVAPLVGQEVFGLVTGLLGGGVRAVLAGLWPVADRETPPLMWRFYRHRLLHDLGTALALAQREALADSDGSPLFWAAFALFGDAGALPAAGPCWRWLARRRQRRHSRLFPSPPASTHSGLG
jgi:tetratricopeptide (TPR) repeat protein